MVGAWAGLNEDQSKLVRLNPRGLKGIEGILVFWDKTHKSGVVEPKNTG